MNGRGNLNNNDPYGGHIGFGGRARGPYGREAEHQQNEMPIPDMPEVHFAVDTPQNSPAHSDNEDELIEEDADSGFEEGEQEESEEEEVEPEGNIFRARMHLHPRNRVLRGFGARPGGDIDGGRPDHD